MLTCDFCGGWVDGGGRVESGYVTCQRCTEAVYGGEDEGAEQYGEHTARQAEWVLHVLPVSEVVAVRGRCGT